MKATTIGRWWWAVALAALFAATSGARADEPPEDAASLLRRGKVAESVEHDVPKAMDLYKKALDAGGSSDAARDAALRLADLLEVRGKRSDALDLLRTVTERLTSRLDEEQKRRVHEAMARLLPAGSHARSPLGDVYVLPAPGSVAVSAASPLDAKILALLARLDDVDPQQRNNVENQIRQALDVVGKDALPTLERAMNSERLDKAQFAAREYARIGKADALPGLERTLREGDGFARGAAVQALLSLQKGDDVSPALVLVLDRIFDLPTLADRRQALLWTLTNHLSEEELLRRQAAGGADADAYLLAAVQRNSAPGIERAIALARGSATLPKGLLESLLAVAGATQSGWSNNRPIWTMKIPTLDPALRREILRLVLAQPLTPESVKAVAGIAAAVQATVPEAEGRQVAHDAWVWALAGKGNVEACRALLQAYVSPPASVFDSAPAGASYGATLASLFQSMRGTNGAQTLLQRDLAASPGFWGVLLDALGALDSTMRSDVLGSVPSADMALIPADLGPRWVALARLPSTQGYPQIVYWSAARGGGADYVALFRERILGRPAGTQLNGDQMQLLGSLQAYGGQDRLAILLALCADAQVVSQAAGYVQGPLASEREKSPDAFYPAVAEALPKTPEPGLSLVLLVLGTSSPQDPAHEPATTLRGRWLDVAASLPGRVDPNSNGQTGMYWVVREAARSDDPRFLDLVRRVCVGANTWSALHTAFVAGLSAYHGPGRLALVLELLGDRHALANQQQALLNLLKEEYAAPAAKERLLVVARDPAAPASRFAIDRLVELRDRAVLLELMEAQRTAATPGSVEHRRALISAATALHLREAIPFLLREFQEGLSSEAAKAMDAIREYHERLERYSTWTKGEDGGRKDLAALLKDPDPEIRRAAVLSIGALGETEALPALVQMAKEESDASVRKAALEAVERLSKSPPKSD